MHLVLRYLYVVLSYLLIPFVLAHLIWKGFGNRAYWHRVPERFGWYSGSGYEGVIWVHAVSVGEVQAAASLVRALLARYPDKTLLLTTTTPTGSDRVRALFGDRVAHCYAPFDFAHAVWRFFAWCKPEVAIILETELWPNLYNACGRRGVPLVLASARVSPKSVGRYRNLVSLFRDTLSNGVVIAAQTEADAERFVSIGANPDRTHVTGNIKFDFELAEGVMAQGQALRAEHAGDRPVWIAASTHTGEEEVVLDAHSRLLAVFPDALLILVPRHPERFDGVASLIERAGFAYARRSEGNACKPGTAVLLGDTMGELMAFYAASDVAFVGGSLVQVGGHNLLEPAALKLPMITGPYTYNAQEIADELREGGVLTIVDNDEALADAVMRLLGDPEECRRQGERARSLIDGNRGALERVLNLLVPLIDA